MRKRQIKKKSNSDIVKDKISCEASINQLKVDLKSQKDAVQRLEKIIQSNNSSTYSCDQTTFFQDLSAVISLGQVTIQDFAAQVIVSCTILSKEYSFCIDQVQIQKLFDLSNKSSSEFQLLKNSSAVRTKAQNHEFNSGQETNTTDEELKVNNHQSIPPQNSHFSPFVPQKKSQQNDTPSQQLSTNSFCQDKSLPHSKNTQQQPLENPFLTKSILKKDCDLEQISSIDCRAAMNQTCSSKKQVQFNNSVQLQEVSGRTVLGELSVNKDSYRSILQGPSTLQTTSQTHHPQNFLSQAQSIQRNRLKLTSSGNLKPSVSDWTYSKNNAAYIRMINRKKWDIATPKLQKENDPQWYQSPIKEGQSLPIKKDTVKDQSQTASKRKYHQRKE
eukprot:403372318